MTDTDDVMLNGRVKWNVVAWFLGVVVSALVTYSATQSNYESRISVLESQQRMIADQQRALSADVNEIRNDVKTLLRRP